MSSKNKDNLPSTSLFTHMSEEENIRKKIESFQNDLNEFRLAHNKLIQEYQIILIEVAYRNHSDAEYRKTSPFLEKFAEYTREELLVLRDRIQPVVIEKWQLLLKKKEKLNEFREAIGLPPLRPGRPRGAEQQLQGT